MCDLEFKNADFVLVDGLVKENTLIAWGVEKRGELYRNENRLKYKKRTPDIRQKSCLIRSPYRLEIIKNKEDRWRMSGA